MFRGILHTCDSEFREINVESLKEASRKRKNNFYNRLPKDSSTLTTHEKCNLEYKSSDHIRSHLKRSAASANEGQWRSVAIKRTRQLHSAILFDLKSDCIFCGIACDVKTDDRTLISAHKRKGCYHGKPIEEKGRSQSKKSY